MTTQSTTFSKSSKAGRGDTSVWTDTPSERAQKAKMKYVFTFSFFFFIINFLTYQKKKNVFTFSFPEYLGQSILVSLSLSLS